MTNLVSFKPYETENAVRKHRLWLSQTDK